MRRPIAIALSCLSLIALFCFGTVSFADTNSPAGDVKEWTFLVFLNGNNNLDSYGKLNINQMENVGSSDQVNVIVQWASLANKKTQRLFITKDTDSSKVTSPVVQDVGSVDMGDWRSLVEFIRWGVENYPAKHYFVDVWDHGSGWHALKNRGIGTRSLINPMDISWDDNTGHSISTHDLGVALAEGARIIGHKVDLYASDACLMAMAEVADEVADSVQTFSGSEEVEPGAGWPYDAFMSKWVANPKISSNDLGKLLTEEYTKSYMGGQNGNSEVTFSTFDLSKMNRFNQAFSKLASDLLRLDSSAKKQVVQATSQSLSFTYSDYRDLGDFLSKVDSQQIVGLERNSTDDLRNALSQFVIANKTTARFNRASGVSIWLPDSSWSYRNYAEKYKALKFDAHTHWGDTLASFF